MTTTTRRLKVTAGFKQQLDTAKHSLQTTASRMLADEVEAYAHGEPQPARRELLDTEVSFVVDEELLATAMRRADQEGVNLSDVIRDGVEGKIQKALVQHAGR